MTEDQRFAQQRPDVLSFKTEPLKEELTIGGQIDVELEVGLSTTDADFVVKVIDEFPDNFTYDEAKDGVGGGSQYLMNGYQMLVRGDVMRGRYRDSFEHPQAFIPGQKTKVSFSMQDVAHTFKIGHRLVVQIQSSCFCKSEIQRSQVYKMGSCSLSFGFYCRLLFSEE